MLTVNLRLVIYPLLPTVGVYTKVTALKLVLLISLKIDVLIGMIFFKKTRTQFDSTTEFAAKLLPAHPITRYSRFTKTWKKTRNKNHVPRPEQCSTSELFPCCLKCSQTTEKSSDAVWNRKANASWLRAEWKWDFGHLIPELITYGVGITPPTPKPESDRLFLLDSQNKRGYLEKTLQEHANLQGDDLHEARVVVTTTVGTVYFPGQITVSSGGQIWIATPRTTLFGKGVEVHERYIFQAVQLPFNLPILVHGSEITVENNKVLLRGVTLN